MLSCGRYKNSSIGKKREDASGRIGREAVSSGEPRVRGNGPGGGNHEMMG